MIYDIKPLAFDPKGIKDLSEKLLVSHYENNHGGAVKRINAITAQLAERDLVDARKWLGKTEMHDSIAVCQSLPGPLAIQVGIYISYLAADSGAPGRAAGLSSRRTS